MQASSGKFLASAVVETEGLHPFALTDSCAMPSCLLPPSSLGRYGVGQGPSFVAPAEQYLCVRSMNTFVQRRRCGDYQRHNAARAAPGHRRGLSSFRLGDGFTAAGQNLLVPPSMGR